MTPARLGQLGGCCRAKELTRKDSMFYMEPTPLEYTTTRFFEGYPYNLPPGRDMRSDMRHCNGTATIIPLSILVTLRGLWESML